MNKPGASFSEADLSARELIVRPHSGRIPAEAIVPIPRQFRRLFSTDRSEVQQEITLKWAYCYEWQPDGRRKIWRIEPHDYQDKIDCHGTTTYLEKLTEYGEETLQRAEVFIDVKIPAFKGLLEQMIREKLGEQSIIERTTTLNDLDSAFGPAHKDLRTEMQFQRQYTGTIISPTGDPEMPSSSSETRTRFETVEDLTSPWQVIWVLSPFWMGTAITSAASGYFVNHSPYNWVIPLIFMILLPTLFLMAITSFSLARKNAYGFFLALFSLSFWVGAFGFK